jgi:hypothetical protein
MKAETAKPGKPAPQGSRTLPLFAGFRYEKNYVGDKPLTLAVNDRHHRRLPPARRGPVALFSRA